MKTIEKHHGISSTILQSFIQAKVEKIQSNTTKVMNASKSAKSISVNPHNNSFKKAEKRLQGRDLKEKTLNSSPIQLSASEQKHASRLSRSINLESNKIISNQQEQNVHNPEHFLARNQLYEKQKELKMQFERRKKLYGINPEKKIKPNLLIKENGGNEDQEELAERAKTYKEMYYKKNGKLKVYKDNKGKKKSKNYQELMKESIERFNEKFISGLDHNHQRIANKNSAFASQEHSFKTNVTNIAQVQKKIKTLMKKLNLQEEMNVSVETIEQLSRIQMMDDAKVSEISSSGLFPKIDQDNHFEETQEIVIPSELQDNDEPEIEESISNTPESHTIEAHDEIKDELYGQQVENVAVEPFQVAQKVDSNHQSNQIQPENIVIIETCQEVQQKKQEQPVKQIQSQANDCLFDEDIDIANEAQDITVQVETLKFLDICCPKVGYGLNPKQQPEELQIDVVMDEDRTNQQSILEQQSLPQQSSALKIPSQVKYENEITESKHQEIANDYSSHECSYDVCLQSFIDLQGNSHQNIEVQVQHFGFCLFLIADSDSDSQPQPQQ